MKRRKMALKFYYCEHCKNLFLTLDDAGVVAQCCGEDMIVLEAGVTDGAAEKHVPVIERDGDRVTVRVGSVPHPMLPEHHIEWIVIEQDKRIQIARLTPGDEPIAEFTIDGDAPIEAYEYCNLHGLWKSEN
jgi:superoxide reductase